MDSQFIEEELYKRIIEKIPIPTVDIVIFSKDLKRVLLFKRENDPAKGVYYTPGGRIFKEEEPIECAVRKMKEELSLDAVETDLRYGGAIFERFENCFFSEEIGASFMNMFYYFILEDERNLRLDSQHSESMWFEVSDKNIFHYVKRKIVESLKRINSLKKLNPSS